MGNLCPAGEIAAGIKTESFEAKAVSVSAQMTPDTVARRTVGRHVGCTGHNPKLSDRTYAHLLSNSGRHERALAEIKVGRELDPLSLRISAEEGQIYFLAKDYDNALDRLQKTIDLDPNFWLSHLMISRVYTEKGMHSEAVAEAKKAAAL